jgi:NADPH:quinone reductase-like Zn-dependent oxidoreductase
MPVPLKQKALVLREPHAALTVETVDVPKPGRGEILVRVQAASLNPVDWRVQKLNRGVINTYPAIIGMDSAGDVVELGDGVTEFSVGDKV